MQDCIFCAIIAGTIPAHVVLETEHCIVLNDIAPKAPIHQLIIPKKHIVDIREFALEDMQLGAEIFSLAQQLSARADNVPFRLMMNNGKQAGQHVLHAHIHFLAGKQLHD